MITEYKRYEYNILQKTIKQYTERIIFSIFNSVDYKKYDLSCWIIEAPDVESPEPVFEGKFYIDYWRFGSKPVFTDILENPTWKDIITACDKLMIDHGDDDGIYFEDINFEQEVNGVKFYKFLIGS